jgi:D-xylose transport system substrate-binding protein
VSGQYATSEGIQNIALGLQTVSVYKPIQDEAGLAAAIALALRNGEGYEDAATSYTSTLASGGSSVAIIGINAADGTAAESPTGDGVVPYVSLVPIGVTIDNIMETVIADEFRTLEEICTGDVAQTDFCKENAA